MTRETQRDWCPKSKEGQLAKVLAGKAPKSLAIKMMCEQCMGYERKLIAGCTTKACPLWHYRPYAKGSKKAAGDMNSSAKSTEGAPDDL